MTVITERPILFSAPMVRAILDSRKTQTRRVVMPQPPNVALAPVCENGWWMWQRFAAERHSYDGETVEKRWDRRCPYGAPGDRLWVRETWRADDYVPDETIYRADATPEDLEAIAGIIKFKPSIHMPRSRCRLVLEVTGVRVERLQDIGNDDAAAEGVYGTDWGHGRDYGGRANYVPVYRALWDSLNKKRGLGWDTNPWVWVIEFRRA